MAKSDVRDGCENRAPDYNLFWAQRKGSGFMSPVGAAWDSKKSIIIRLNPGVVLDHKDGETYRLLLVPKGL